MAGGWRVLDAWSTPVTRRFGRAVDVLRNFGFQSRLIIITDAKSVVARLKNAASRRTVGSAMSPELGTCADGVMPVGSGILAVCP
jgi:hypothetical protein